MPDDLNKQFGKKVDQLDQQVRREADLRIIILLLEVKKRAREILTNDQADLFGSYLQILLENPDSVLPEPAQQAFQNFIADPTGRDVYLRLQKLVLAKVHTRLAEEPNKMIAPLQPLNAVLRHSGYGDFRPPGDSYSTRTKKT